MFTSIASQKQSLAAFLLLAGAFLLPISPACAQEAALSSEVSMDVTGADATDAREQAMKKAEREGLSKLLEKLAPERRDALMEKLEDPVISAMVKGVEVLDEKIAGPRYRALLKISYNALAVNTLLDNKVTASGAPDIPITSTSILVLPLFEEDGKTQLWEPANPWRAAWKRVILETSGGNVLVPYADVTDSASLKTEAAQSANFAALLSFFTRYGVGEVVVLKATLRKDEKGLPVAVDILRRQIGKTRSETYVADYRADPQEDADTLLYRAAQDLIDQIGRQREAILSAEAQNSAADGRIMVLVPITTLDSWTRVREALLKLQTVKRIEMLAISPRQVDVMLQFKGEKAALANDIASLGLKLSQTENYWVISRE